MNRPVFGDRVTATLEGEVISYGSEAAARRELRALRPSGELGPGAMPKREVLYSERSELGFMPPQQPATVPEVSVPQPEPEPTRWLLGFGRSFRKAVDSIDRKLQGRTLEAIAGIALAPLTIRGDTVKPLSGDMAGLWRYLIGDFRLVYHTDEATRTITLYDFASRGSVYD